MNQMSTKHPHEPDVAPIYDSAGRCLICVVAVRDSEIESLIARLRAAEEAKAQLWIALANIRDACGPESHFYKEAAIAIGTATDPADGTVERVAMENRRMVARQRDEARERLAAAKTRVKELEQWFEEDQNEDLAAWGRLTAQRDEAVTDARTLAGAARIYLDAFDEDEMMPLPEKLMLQDVEAALARVATS